MLSTVILAAGFLSAQLVNAQSLVPLYGQCGGLYFEGSKECAPPGVCTYINIYYSQCLPPVKPTTTTTSTKSATSGCTDQGPGKCSTSSSSSSSKVPSSSLTIITEPTRTSVTSKTTIITDPTRTSVTSKTTSKSYTIITDPPPTSWSTVKPSSTSSSTCSTKKPVPTKFPPIFSPADGTKVFLLELNELPSTAAHLTATGIEGPYDYTTSLTGSPISVKPYDPCNPRIRWLSIDEKFPASYKPVVWTNEVQTKYWVIAPGEVIYTSEYSPFGAVKTFLACGDDWELYLQTGDEYPPDVYCEKTTLVLAA